MESVTLRQELDALAVQLEVIHERLDMIEKHIDLMINNLVGLSKNQEMLKSIGDKIDGK